MRPGFEPGCLRKQLLSRLNACLQTHQVTYIEDPAWNFNSTRPYDNQTRRSENINTFGQLTLVERNIQ